MTAALDRFCIDPALAELASDKRATARRPPAHVSIQKVREAANGAMCRQPSGPAMYRVWEEVVAGPGGALTLRFYRPEATRPATGILFAHGGGFTLGNLETHDPQCRWLARYSGSLVVAIDYRLAPEHPFPSALDDCSTAWDWLVAEHEQLAVGEHNWALAGDSAGANLVLSLALRLRKEPCRPAALALFYPFLDRHCNTPSAHQLADGPGLSRDAMLWFWENYLGPEQQSLPVDVLGQQLGGLPPTSLFLAAADPLVDEGLSLASELEEAAVPQRCRIYDGMVHGFLHLGALTPKAGEALRDAASDLSSALAATLGDQPRPIPDNSLTEFEP